MRALVCLTILLAVAGAEARDRRCRWSRTTRTLDCGGYAFFEFAPASGAGMPSACSTTAPTGARGEQLTFTRTGNATCSKKGLATTGIADGDLVVMSGNVARVEPDADGVLGLRVEGARTNVILRSQEFDNASWGKTAVAPLSAVGVWPNDAGAPDGTQTADALHFEATAAGQASRIFQSTLSVGITYGCGVYVRSARPVDGGVATAGSIDIIIDKGTTGGFSCSTCAHTPDSWNRCEVPGGVISGSTGSLLIGNDSRPSTCGNGPRASSQDVLLWQADCHSGGPYVTSPIPTVAAAATRNAEAASFTLPSAIGPSFSMGVSMWWPSSSVGAVTALQIGTAAPDLARIGRNTNTAATLLINATTTNPAVSAMGTTQQRGTLNDNAGTRTATWQGASVAAPASSMTGTTTALSIGALDGIISRVCVDPDPTRCR